MTASRTVDGRIHALVERLHGRRFRAATRAEVVAAIGRRGLDHAVGDGRLIRLLPDTYVAGARVDEHTVRCAAATVRSSARLVIAGESALHLLDSDFPAPARVRCVAAPPWTARAPAWIDLSRRPLPRLRALAEGLSCLMPELAVLDAWARAPALRRKNLLYEALWMRIATPVRVADAAATVTRLPDSRRFNAIMREFLAGATSPTEVMAKREVFRGAGYADFERQVPMVVAGRNRVADMLHRRGRLVVELDGRRYHSTPEAIDRDRKRDAEFASEGWQTVRFSFRDLRDRPDWCRGVLQRTLAVRLAVSSRRAGVA